MKLTDNRNIILIALAVMQLCMVSCEDIFGGSSREEDEAKLAKVRNEITALSTSINCDNAAEWRFVPIGEKACGGPAGYVAYSTKIDTVDFKSKVETYTNLSKKFNEKWNIASDCMFVSPPAGIRCENGKAVFMPRGY